jgi:hypothetical protein
MVNLDYKEVVERSLSNNFGWNIITSAHNKERLLSWANIVGKKRNKTRAIIIKDTDSLAEVYWKFFDSILNQNNLEICIAVPTHRISKYQTEKVEGRLKELGVGLIEITSKTIKEVIPPQSRHAYTKPKTQTPRMRVIIFFLSSEQDIPERRVVEEKLKEAGEHHGFLSQTIMLEREVDVDENEMKRKIKDGIKNADLFIAIIGEEWRKWVEYEVNYAFKVKKPRQIACFVKTAAEDRTKKLESFLNRLQGKPKYAVFISQDELGTEVANAIRERLKRLGKI